MLLNACLIPNSTIVIGFFQSPRIDKRLCKNSHDGDTKLRSEVPISMNVAVPNMGRHKVLPFGASMIVSLIANWSLRVPVQPE